MKNKLNQDKYNKAVCYHSKKLNEKVFKQWFDWVRYRKDRQASKNKIIFF